MSAFKVERSVDQKAVADSNGSTAGRRVFTSSDRFTPV